MGLYSDIADPERWALPAVIEEQAARAAESRFVTCIGGGTLTFGELRDDAARVAGMLAAAGLAPGDRVALMLPGGVDFLRAWAGIGRLGAAAVILNQELSGDFLAHPLVDAAPRAFIIHADFLPCLVEITERLGFLEHVIVAGAPASLETTGNLPLGTSPFDRWRSSTPYQGDLPRAADIACIMYTSGTTGAPKGVIMPHAHCFLFGLGVIENLGLTDQDHYYVCLPLSHANGLFMQLGAVLIGGFQATYRSRFSASSWLQDLRDSGATVTNTLGAITSFVVAQPPSSSDRDHRLRIILSVPNHQTHDCIWRERFGIASVVSGFGMTEINIPIYGDPRRSRPGTCGWPYKRYFQVEIRDPATDQPVPKGDTGEIVVRPLAAHAFMAGYHNLPAATVEAWRNLWFHTGDAAYMDESGCITFVDRIKDCIRRRGENISATDLEVCFAQIPGVAEVAAFAVPSELDGGEDEVMLVVVLHAGAHVTAENIAEHARRSVPRFARPRFVEFIAELPKTGSQKIKKAELRRTGRTGSTVELEV